MDCPQCGSRTLVTETRGLFRDRRCTNPVCHLGFTTREQIMNLRHDGRYCAKTRALQLEPRARSIEDAGAGSNQAPSPDTSSEAPNSRRPGRPKLRFQQAGARA